ncbi:uncharacterized protein ARMOST_16147 [Armillaria ostoyae]|uniref:Uncharacterized protein n=1 Tax=Armillaria ostoyae TaxID=47428 RepID=A0A284RVC7_ARMOS|nr:uncharacterized protein ARMOST_16147 [Armillaria ostoyae]
MSYQVATKPKVIYEKPLHLLGRGDEAVDITSSAIPQRYRLVDCKALTENTVLRICEFTDFPVVAYCAISYVWRNVRTGKSFVEGGNGIEFDVKVAEGRVHGVPPTGLHASLTGSVMHHADERR